MRRIVHFKVTYRSVDVNLTVRALPAHLHLPLLNARGGQYDASSSEDTRT